MEAASALLRRDNIANANNDENVGSARNSSLSGFLSTLVISLITFAVFVLLFIILRRSNRRIYAPRTYVGTVSTYKRLKSKDDDKDGYADEVEGVGGFSGILGWIKGVWKIPDEVVLRTNGLDGFLFLRYLRKAQMICFVGCCLIFPILFPINATGGGGQSQLDLLSMSNIDKSTNKNRYYAHALVAYVYFSFVLFTVYRELVYYTTLRQAYLLSPFYSTRISARTLLITTIPPEYNRVSKLRMIFPTCRRLWINSDTTELEEVIKERDEVAMKLEGAEVNLIKTTDAARRKKGITDKPDSPEGQETEGESGSIAARWLERKKRPTHKLKPLIGEKVDTIDWCRGKLAELNPKAEELQNVHKNGEGKKFNSAFIEFDSQSAAQTALQTLAHHLPLHMAPRYIGVTPDEVIWASLKMQWWERLVKYATTTAFIVAMIIFWSIPVAVVGAISNISYLTTKVPFLGFINDIPAVILGIITGLLPAVMLAVLMALVPIIMRIMARIQGAPSLSEVELKVQNYYMAFQVIQAFLVTTMTSAASAAVPTILKDPSQITNLLAQSLPTASNFYISYMILQGLSISAGSLLQLSGVILYRVLSFLDNTPRKQFKRWSSLSGLGWGTVFPVYTNICVIALTYSIISPLVLAFAVVGLGLLYFAYRYNFLFVYNVNIDTKGLVYPRAWYQTMIGIYLAEVCLIGLFAIATAIGPLILMIIYLIFTVLFQAALSSAIEPLLNFLPQSLQKEEEALLSEEGRQSTSARPKPSVDGPSTAEHTNSNDTETDPLYTAPAKKANFLARFMHPERFESYFEMRKIVPQEFPEAVYTHEQERDAYMHPAITSQPIEIWLPRDEAGVSRQECAHTSVVNPCSDDGAYLDAKGKVLREEASVPPGWEEKPVY